jgi:hypothetical protein
MKEWIMKKGTELKTIPGENHRLIYSSVLLRIMQMRLGGYNPTPELNLKNNLPPELGDPCTMPSLVECCHSGVEHVEKLQ